MPQIFLVKYGYHLRCPATSEEGFTHRICSVSGSGWPPNHVLPRPAVEGGEPRSIEETSSCSVPPHPPPNAVPPTNRCVLPPAQLSGPLSYQVAAHRIQSGESNNIGVAAALHSVNRRDLMPRVVSVPLVESKPFSVF